MIIRNFARSVALVGALSITACTSAEDYAMMSEAERAQSDWEDTVFAWSIGFVALLATAAVVAAAEDDDDF